MTSALLHRTMNTAAAAEYLDVSEATLKRWRQAGEGPKFIRLGKKLIKYRQSDLDHWILKGGTE